MEEPAGGPPSAPGAPPQWPAPAEAGTGAETAGPLPTQPPVTWAPPPLQGPRPELRPVVSPPGHPLYVTYAVVMMLSYVGSAIAGCLMLRGDLFVEQYSPELLRLLGILSVSVGVAMALIYLVGVVAPKRPWGWVYKLVLICLGLTSCWLWPLTIPLFRRWLKPEMKRYYRMR